jgi:DNA-3-methyladenine glycosylase
MVAYAVMSTLEPDYAWLESNSLEVAPKLLGWELVSHAGGAETAGRIVEVEAYHGATDPASHAYRGLTPRTTPMFERGGAIYVYLSYGVHCCINIVTGPAGEASAVLIRALEPTVGLEVMSQRRGNNDPRKLSSGPGKLTQALGITLALSGSRLGQSLSLRPPTAPIELQQIATGPRVGVSQAVGRPWRFWLRDSPFISKAKTQRES